MVARQAMTSRQGRERMNDLSARGHAVAVLREGKWTQIRPQRADPAVDPMASDVSEGDLRGHTSRSFPAYVLWFLV